MTKKLVFLPFFALLTALLPIRANDMVRVFAYPAIIYDDARCSVYQDYLTDLTFTFHYDGKQIHDLRQSGTRFFLELPEELKLVECSLMDGWKKPNEYYREFKKSPVKRDGRDYLRYELPIPKTVVQSALKKPLAGGMFGGTTNNLVVAMVKPDRPLPALSKIYWETVGKYPCQGQFSVYPVRLPAEIPKLRISLQMGTHLPNLGYSDAAIREQIRLFKDLKVHLVNAQMPSGPNQGRRELWQQAGFGFYSCMMHVFWSDGKDADEVGPAKPEDYLVGLDGRRSKGRDRRIYRMRTWCPQSMITPGTYVNRKLLRMGREAAAAGAVMLDIDLEPDITLICHCPACRKAFFKFAGIPEENTAPEALVRKYPSKWYRFRSEQTRLLYQALRDGLRKEFPNLKVGANAVNHHMEYDFEDQKFGICGFAEDPRLMAKSLDFVMADTLMGGVYDPVSVDALYLSTRLPIVAIPGSSYCVGFSHGTFVYRRQTAEMTGDTYGYDQREAFHKLGMLHLAANGAAGLRYGCNEACVARATAEAAQLLAQTEKFYLDGKRADRQCAVSDLTRGASRWTLDRSRIRGGIWKHFYDGYCGMVQSRTHTLNGEYLTGLYNWDPWQTKRWHVAMKDLPPGKWYAADLVTQTRLEADGRDSWTAAELAQGFSLDIPAAGCRLLQFSQQPFRFVRKEKKKPEPAGVPAYDQYAWRIGSQLDIRQVIGNDLKRPLKLLKQYGKDQ